jgi:hypothetical protein
VDGGTFYFSFELAKHADERKKFATPASPAGKPASRCESIQVQLSSEPLFKESRSFCAFDAAAHCIQCTATQSIRSAVKAQPVWQVKDSGQWLDFQLDVTELKEALLEDDAQDLIPEHLLGAFFG